MVLTEQRTLRSAPTAYIELGSPHAFSDLYNVA